MLRWLAIGAFALIALDCATAAQVSYYQLPPDAYPHDVAPGPDGVVWYSGQRKGVLGRFDPKTGGHDQIPLGRNSAPHGIIVASDGTVWLSDGGQNAIVRYDPATKKRDVFPLPAQFPNANLNTGVFGKNGIYWFTGQSGLYGRVDPKTGKVDAWAAPKGSGPYGITATPSGDVWFVSLAGNYLAKVDAVSGAATTIDPPTPGAGPRRVWSDSKGMLWVSLWNAGALGRYDPSAKGWKTYPLPKSTGGCYSVYVDDKDRVWVTDWLENAIQMFDPATEKFTSYKSDKRSANVRQMNGRPGEAWGGESGTDRLVVVRD
ncbi:MAG: Vgb family protein [Xanthobacteraceae bacterium]